MNIRVVCFYCQKEGHAREKFCERKADEVSYIDAVIKSDKKYNIAKVIKNFQLTLTLAARVASSNLTKH